MKKKGNIAFSVLIVLFVMCIGAVVISLAASSRDNARVHYARLSNRYIAESGVDVSIGLLVNYIGNRELTATYKADEDGKCYMDETYMPYLLDEIADSEDEDVRIDIVSDEARNYLSSIGYVDYKKENSLSLTIDVADKENFKISNMCIEPDFVVETDEETGKDKQSKLRPIFVTVKTNYPNGNVLCNVKISNIYAQREAFEKTDENEMENCNIELDVSAAEIEYINYQNYGGAEN